MDCHQDGRFDNYRSTRGRCLLNWQSFRGFGKSRDEILEVLDYKLGLRQVDGSLAAFAESLIGTGEFERRADPSPAPQVFDCSSLTQYLYSLLGVEIPRLAIDQFHFGECIDLLDARDGDLVFTSGDKKQYEYYFVDSGCGVGHVGLVIGGYIIHASNGENTKKAPAVRREILDDFLRPREYRGTCRILPSQENQLVLELPMDANITWSREIVWLYSTTL